MGARTLIRGILACSTTLTRYSPPDHTDADKQAGGPGDYYCAVRPPSIISSVPVTNEDSSEAK